MRLCLWQRATAAAMVPLVLLHIAVIFYATRRGMTAADILSRTHGSIMWASYYGLFVAAASIHASIGVRNVLVETDVPHPTCLYPGPREHFARVMHGLSPEVVRRRMEAASGEISHWPEYDYVIVNQRDRLDQAVSDLKAIITTERLRVCPRTVNL